MFADFQLQQVAIDRFLPTKIDCTMAALRSEFPFESLRSEYLKP